MANPIGASPGPLLVPGEIYMLPPRTTPLPDDPDWHPHMLLTPGSAGQGTFVLASGSPAEKEKGAHCHEVRAVTSGQARNGLTKTTFFYGSILLVYPCGAARNHFARLHNLRGELTAVRASTLRGVACGEGTHLRYTAPTGGAASWRGKVVELQPLAARELSSKYALVLTSHAYSARKAYQAVVPLLIAEEWESLVPDVVRIDRPWVASLLRGTGGTAFVTAGGLVRTLKHEKHIRLWTSRTIDERDLEQIELQVRTYLQL